jgi:hypothetical protein
MGGGRDPVAVDGWQRRPLAQRRPPPGPRGAGARLRRGPGRGSSPFPWEYPPDERPARGCRRFGTRGASGCPGRCPFCRRGHRPWECLWSPSPGHRRFRVTERDVVETCAAQARAALRRRRAPGRGPATGHHGRINRALQPAAVLLFGGAGKRPAPGPRPRGRGRRHGRYRPFQESERHPRPRGRGHRFEGGRPAAQKRPAAHRCGGPLRRRGVCGAPAGHGARSKRGRSSSACAAPWPPRPSTPTAASLTVTVSFGVAEPVRGGRKPGTSPGPGRPRALPGQGTRTRPRGSPFP